MEAEEGGIPSLSHAAHTPASPHVASAVEPPRRPTQAPPHWKPSESTPRTEFLLGTAPAAHPSLPTGPLGMPPEGKPSRGCARGTPPMGHLGQTRRPASREDGLSLALERPCPRPRSSTPPPMSSTSAARPLSERGPLARAVIPADAGALHGHVGSAPALLECVGGWPQAQDLPTAQALAPFVEHSELQRREAVSPAVRPGTRVPTVQPGAQTWGWGGAMLCLSLFCPCPRGPDQRRARAGQPALPLAAQEPGLTVAGLPVHPPSRAV